MEVDTETFRDEPDEGKVTERETMFATLDAIEAREKAEASDEPKDDAKPEGAQPRDPAGRFANKDAAAPASTGKADQPATGATEPQAAGAAPAAIEAPQSWSAEAKAYWASLSPDAQKYIAQREGDVHKQITSQGERLKAYETLEPVIAPRRAALAATYGNEAAALQQLFAISDFASSDPHGFVQWYAGQRGIDLRTLIQSHQQPQQQQPMDPQLAAALQRQNELEQRVAAREQAEYAREASTVQAEVDAFSKDKPYFDEVRPIMAQIIANGLVNTMDEAYDRAIWALPNIRERMLADKATADRAAAEKADAEAKAKADAEAKERARAAARAGRVNVSSKGAGASPSPPKDIRRLMEETYDALNA